MTQSRPPAADSDASGSGAPWKRGGSSPSRPVEGGRPPDRPAAEGGCGPASPIQRAFEAELGMVAGSEATVLLLGESGTGKSASARRLHAASRRADGPLVEVHLGALTPTLVESELFGHEKGAFTDASRSRAGCFRRAQGGTLVLDDVDLLPGPAQVKLLRALQERVVEPVGAEAPVAIDVRFCATTNRDLRAEVEAGRFREDLYYRLAVVTLEVPPLRARSEDLPGLVETLLAGIGARLGRPARPLGAGCLERLGAHAWPGNVRELENALERVCALGPAQTPIDVHEFDFLDEVAAGIPEELARQALAHGLTAEQLEAALLAEALREQRGNLSAAARRVGLTRRAFEYRVARTGEGDDGGHHDEAEAESQRGGG
ncbi:sigma-54-dependent transcriptional regulator [Engelhardtia mirabilis]|uniref:Transcriptional regulatory protein ZraR n=1 Tax=Engelhardtia mirabilis TaxID=2528011 RepID=A0A518BMP1_9BACT|nr:Transcriptional regulatory protein ZraR [Planctomycetes bacterium Pla133]QDV02574.1 Transcriptional regulatory protein ZraR [Planctomycetes bacterium Pla86]